MASATHLSRHDYSVLSALFDPEGTPSDVPLDVGTVPILLPGELSAEIRQSEIIACLNCAEPSETAIRAALVQLDSLLEGYPHRASAFNNRAQIRRMLQQGDHCHSSSEDARLIWEDLCQAIHLASRESTLAKQSQVLAAAHTHRGHLLYQALKDPSLLKILLSLVGQSTQDSESLEEMASRDFTLGGRHGNKMAKQMSVLTNPYAKLCGQRVKQALADEAQGPLERHGM